MSLAQLGGGLEMLLSCTERTITGELIMCIYIEHNLREGVGAFWLKSTCERGYRRKAFRM